MLAVTSGGVRYPWTSPAILGLFAFSAVTGALFVVRLMTAPEPLIPIAILKDPIARCAIAANGLGWGGIIGLNIFLPIYLQWVLGMSATAAGLSLMVLMATLNASAGFSAQLLVRHRRYKIVPLIGLALAIVSVATLAVEVEGLATWKFELLIAVLGIGFGPIAPLSTTVVAEHGRAAPVRDRDRHHDFHPQPLCNRAGRGFWRAGEHGRTQGARTKATRHIRISADLRGSRRRV